MKTVLADLSSAKLRYWPLCVMSAVGSFWKKAATTVVGTLLRVFSKAVSRPPVMRKSTRPAASMGRLLTCGPPCWIVTSRPCLA